MPLLNYLAHRRDCNNKQAARTAAIADLPPVYHTPLTTSEASILNTPVSTTATLVRNGEFKPIDVLRSYGKRALYAHSKTNCLTEVLLPSAEGWLSHSTTSSHSPELGGVNLNGPLAGVPVSVKDTVNVKGYDSCIGYSRWVGRPAEKDAAIIRLLKDAGAVPFVKTNVPITLLSFESNNDVFGATDNPHVRGFSPGGSTGGEAALLALGGSRIGIGTDVAGSVRVPAAWSGIYALRCSTGRFPKAGNVTSMPGQEGVPAVYSPMTKSLPDLRYFLETIINMKPWEYDYTVHPIPWRASPFSSPITFGVLRNDGVVAPTPAISRALDITVAALRAAGHSVTELPNTPSCATVLNLASALLNADAGDTFSSHFISSLETNDAGVSVLHRILTLPRLFSTVYVWYLRHIRRDPITANLVAALRSGSVADQWRLVTRREELRNEWWEWKRAQGVDLILTPANALPAVPRGGMQRSIASCGYTFMWNMLDWSAGVVPVGVVDPVLDRVTGAEHEKEGGWGMGNMLQRMAWGLYDAEKMAGLPVAVQVVGGRLEEERVLEGMETVVEALGEAGVVYKEIVVEGEVD